MTIIIISDDNYLSINKQIRQHIKTKPDTVNCTVSILNLYYYFKKKYKYVRAY